MKTALKTILTLVAASLACGAASADVPRDSVLCGITGCAEAKEVVLLQADGNGASDCLPAFREAIKQAQSIIEKKGYARIVVPPGEYQLNGPIHFISGLTIEIQDGATLHFSDNPEHYLPVVETSWEGSYCRNYSPFIYGKDLHDIAIIGKGTIDGNAAATFGTWRDKQSRGKQLSREFNHNRTSVSERVFGEGYYLRPQFIQFYNCRNITIDGVFITNSPFWCVHLLRCDNAICRGLRFEAKLENNDGIDPESSSNILIENITFNNGDDNIAVKSGRDHDGRAAACPSENIIIRHCSFKGLHAVVLGSEMSGGIRNVWIDDCTFGGYCKRGLYAKTNPDRGGYIHNIYMNNCRFGEVEDLIYITSKYAGEGLDNHYFTDIGSIHISNISCAKVNNTAIMLQGTEACPLRDISFENVVVDQSKVGMSMTNTDSVSLRGCSLGDCADVVPTLISPTDNIFRE